MFFAFIIYCIYFSEDVHLIAEVARSQFLLTAFVSQPAFLHLFVSRLSLLIQYLNVSLAYIHFSKRFHVFPLLKYHNVPRLNSLTKRTNRKGARKKSQQRLESD